MDSEARIGSFLMLPTAIPLPAPVSGTPAPVGGVAPSVSASPPVAPSAIGRPAGSLGVQKQLDLSFTVDKTQLYHAWNAVANLAEMADKVTVSLRAESAKGFDKSKLQNGVIEPLREADLIE
jgi:hypothetical protein